MQGQEGTGTGEAFWSWCRALPWAVQEELTDSGRQLSAEDFCRA